MAVVDLEYLKEISDNDAEFMLSMITTFIETTPVSLEEMRASMDAGNIEKIGELAHKIKPSLTFMGINSCKELIVEIESKGKMGNEDGLSEMINTLTSTCNQAYVDLKAIIELGL